MRTNALVRSLSLGLLLAFCSLAIPKPAAAQIAVAVTIAPPVIPVYEQPICPGDGYLWTPGYWAWDPDAGDYYWVPGTWVLAPEVGFLWTPGWWGWRDGGFFFTAGYWGPVVGFYGGINYGFGYFGTGFVGGRWDGGHFFYNRAVLNVNVNVIHNVYETRITNINDVHVSYNGGRGGLTARPTPEEEAAARDRHIGPVAAQTQHIEEARNNPDLRFKANHGSPAIAATARPGDFKTGVIASHGAPPARNEGEARPEGRPAGGGNVVHPKDIPPAEHMKAPNTGNAKTDQKYQQQQQKLEQQQEKERQQLQTKQDAEHARTQNQPAAKQQQIEQRHSQQTQQLQQRQTQQRQQMEQHQAPRASNPKH